MPILKSTRLQRGRVNCSAWSAEDHTHGWELGKNDFQRKFGELFLEEGSGGCGWPTIDVRCSQIVPFTPLWIINIALNWEVSENEFFIHLIIVYWASSICQACNLVLVYKHKWDSLWLGETHSPVKRDEQAGIKAYGSKCWCQSMYVCVDTVVEVKNSAAGAQREGCRGEWVLSWALKRKQDFLEWERKGIFLKAMANHQSFQQGPGRTRCGF